MTFGKVVVSNITRNFIEETLLCTQSRSCGGVVRQPKKSILTPKNSKTQALSEFSRTRQWQTNTQELRSDPQNQSR